jgi:serine/threonine-protein kinase
MICPSCQSSNDDAAEACFTCGKALFALTQGVVLAARYEVLRPLGAGGMGRVYKARDRVLDEDVAIKVLRPEFVRDPEMSRRFRSEIKLARKVSHRNVCRIHEYGEDGALCYISMEYIEGVNLKDYLAARTLSLEDAYDLVLQVAHGLRAVHEHGIIHRDFKASNIMIDGRGVVKLMDFGIAKEAAVDTTGVTGSAVIGTPEYMSPEQGGGGKVDLRSDIYSLGCVVFEVFAGRPPFRGDTPLATLYKHQNEPPPLDAARVPDGLLKVLRVALAKDPAERYESVSAFIEALRAARSTSPDEHTLVVRETTTSPRSASPLLDAPVRPPPDAPAPSHASIARQLWPWVGLAIFAVGAVALIGGSGLRKASPTEESGAPSPSSKATRTAAAPPAASPRATVGPVAPAERAPDGRSPALEPEAAEARSPRPSAQPAPAGGSSPSPTPVETPSPPGTSEETPAAEARGSLTLLIVPESDVTVDGRPIGRVAMREIMLEPGSHTVRVLNPDYEPLQRKITIRAGVASKLVLDLAEKGIRVPSSEK